MARADDRWWDGFVGSARRQGAWLRANPWDLALITWLPLLAGLLVVWIFSAGIPRDLPVVLVDQDRSAPSRQLARLLDASPGIRIADQVDDWGAAEARLREREAFGIVWIPAHFGRDLALGTGTSIQWHYNGQFQAHVGGLTRDVRTVVATYSAGVAVTARTRRGQPALLARAQVEPIRLQLVSVYNEKASYEPFLALSLVPALLQIFVSLAAVNALGRELKNGTVPQWLAAARGRWSAALAGALLWPALAFALHALLFVAVFVGRGWAIEGSGLAIALGLALLIAAHLALGVLFVGTTLSLRNAISAAGLITAPAFAFCGQGYPLVAMPPLARFWAELLPLTHYLQLQSRHWLGGAPLAHGLGDIAILAAGTTVIAALGYRLMATRAAAPAAWGRV